MKSVTFRRGLPGTLTAAALALPALITGPTEAMAGPGTADWQLTRLIHPTHAQAAREQRGGVFVDDGPNAPDIERSADQPFDRVGATMLINAVPSGQDDTGTDGGTTVRTDDDGC